MKLTVLSRVLVLSSAVLLLIGFASCSDEGGPVQNQQTTQNTGDRIPVMPKTTATTLLQLNPGSNTYLGCEGYYSSAGANTPPIWVYHSINLAAYAGKNVRITFLFATGDALYNKWEGWYLDDINIDGRLDDVESGAQNWTATGYWHIDDYRSVSSSHSWRYANAAGNYQGAYIAGDCSDQANSGALSIEVGLGAAPSMSFQTLWQIEGVQPAQFDIMQVLIEDIGIVTASVDIKPGGCPNPMNTGANGTFPVAIVGTADFDVTKVDDATVTLNLVPQGPQMPSDADVSTPYGGVPTDCMDCNASGADGMLDATYYFNNQLIVGTLGIVQTGDCIPLIVRGRFANSGLYFEGQDVVRIKTK